MSGQLIAAIIMFFITIGFTTVFLLPALKIKPRNDLVKFYWSGVWMFLGGLTAFSGSQQVLDILGQDVEVVSTAIIAGIIASFVFFVVFAWGRLALSGVMFATAKVKIK